MMINRTFIVFVVAVAAMMTGCAEKVTMREGQSVHLVPVNKAWSSVVTASNTQQVKADVFDIASNNLSEIAQKGVVVSYSAQGQTIANQLKRWLIKQGVASKKIDMVKVIPSSSYDIQLQFNEFLVVTESCTPTQVGTYGFNEDGCYADNARWQSMVNPNTMIQMNSNN